jgi:hypothetical protein
MALTDSPPTTTQYSITLPEVGKNKNNWGVILNAAIESAASNLKAVDDTLGNPTDSSTPSLAYQLTQAVTNASTAASNSATAITVASKLTNNALVAITNDLNTAASNAATAASNASAAKTAADAALILANDGYYSAN